MSAYVAPVRDMLFALHHLAGLAEVSALPGGEDVDDELVASILEEAGKFAGNVLAPLNASGDRQGNTCDNGRVSTADGFAAAYASFCENGWNAMPAGSDIGGQGLPTLVTTPVLEMWKAANMAFSLCPMLTLGAVEAIRHHASAGLQQTFLPKMVEGSWTGTMNLTEPQAGSDLSAVRTRAVPDGDVFRIFGTKIFITWGEHDMAENIVHLVLARLPDAPAGVKGISLFIVPKFLVNADGSLGERNDLTCASLEHKLGIHASPTAVMVFGERDGAIGHLVGEPNRGLEYMFTMMNHARLNVGLEGVAIAERAYQQAVGYARERIQGRPVGDRSGDKKPILHHPDVRRMLLDMKARVHAMRALAYYTAGQMDLAHRHPEADVRTRCQARVDFLTPVVKGWCTETSIGVASTGIQVHGGMGYIEETGASQHLRDARITTIYEGTTGIQANDLIGRKLAREQGVTARALLDEMRASCDRLAGSPHAVLPELAASLARAVAALGESIDWLLAHHDSQPQATAAGAVPFLKLVGTVTGGWLMLRAAEVAVDCSNASDPTLYRTHLGTARYYLGHVLPEALLYREAIVCGAPAVLDLDAELL